jgi:hypothetical protein
MTGGEWTSIRFTSWKRSWIRSDSAGLVTARPTGLLGKTTGRGKQSNSYVPNRSIKEVLGYPLAKRFRELIREMCDALSRNVPKLSAGVEILLANCLAHGRRQFVEVAANFPDECRYGLEILGQA